MWLPLPTASWRCVLVASCRSTHAALGLKREVRSQKSEVRSQKSEVRSQKSEVRRLSFSSLLLRSPPCALAGHDGTRPCRPDRLAERPVKRFEEGHAVIQQQAVVHRRQPQA